MFHKYLLLGFTVLFILFYVYRHLQIFFCNYFLFFPKVVL